MSTLVFKNVEKLNNKEYIMTLTGAKILEQWHKGNLKYIPEIQRGKKIIENAEGEEIEVPIYSQSNVNKIKKSILEDDFFVSQLTFNVDESITVKYSETKKELKIIDGILAISDGQHRIRALDMIQKEKELGENDFDLNSINFPIKISHYNQEKAQQQFHQFTLGTKISSSRSEFFNRKDFSNKICIDLYEDSVLSNKIETIKNTISKNDKNHIVSFATLKNAIELNFNTEKYLDDSEKDETTKFLKGFFKELFKVIPEFDDYDDRIELREENSLMCENFTFYGYLAIAEYLTHEKDWKDYMKYIRKINMRKDSAPWIGNIIKRSVKSKKIGKETKYTIINNSQSRKEMATLMLKSFKKCLKDEI